jgi:hypothetical protein
MIAVLPVDLGACVCNSFLVVLLTLPCCCMTAWRAGLGPYWAAKSGAGAVFGAVSGEGSDVWQGRF